MQTEFLPLLGATPGLQHTLKVLRFGRAGQGPKAYIQAALHADEVPALLVARELGVALAELEAQGAVLGEVVLVPYANPLGLGQQLLGLHHGRFDLRDGVNFNRLVPDLSEAAAEAVQGQLGADAHANAELVRAALRAAAGALEAKTPAQDLKRKLLQLAIDAHVVLDLHCDSEAVMHVYALTPQAQQGAELGAMLGAQAILLATESGDSPFDESCSRPWFVARERHPQHPLPLGCFSTTVELRGEADTSHVLARQDALALLEFLRREGVLAGTPAPLPAPLCEPTPLSASEPVTSAHGGVLVFHQAPGARVAAGTHIADVVNPDSGEVHPLHCQSAGVLYARIAHRWVLPGQSVCKVAGSTLQRTGKLLSS